MEPASFALAIAAIPGIFKSTVDCFEYVKLGSEFGRDYTFSRAKLEAAEMQYTRWGVSMGLLEEPFDVGACFKNGGWQERDITKAKKWIGLINDAFENAKTTSERYKCSREDEDEQPEQLVVLDDKAQIQKLDEPGKKLLLSMRGITKSRQKHQSLAKKTSWALYRKNDFESLIETICRLIDNLVKLFPALEDPQRNLCREEIKEIKRAEIESVPRLIEVVGANDVVLNRAISEEVETAGQLLKNVWVNTEGFARVGDTHVSGSTGRSPGMSVTGLYITGAGTTQAGHYYGSGQQEAIHEQKRSGS